MKSNIRFFSITALLFLGAVSCAERQNSYQSLRQNQGFTGLSEGLQLLGNETLKIVSTTGEPIVGASIMLGYESGNPFPGNVLTTDPEGQAAIPADWKAALPITAQAPGFITTTIPVAQPGTVTITMTRQESQQEFEVKGATNGYGRIIQDGKVDFGLVIPALSRDQMLAFDVSTMISPRQDQLEIIGNAVKIPSNIALPQQRESYVFPIELNKPDYRLYMRQKGQYKFAAIHGQFPLQRVVNDIRAGKSIFEVINHFNFLEGGQKTVDVANNVEGLVMDVNQVRFDSNVSVRAPALAANEVMIGVSLHEQDGLLMPTDLKRLNANQTLNLKAIGSARSVLSLLLEDTGKKTAGAALGGFLAPLSDLANMIPYEGAAAERAPLDFSKLSFALLPANGMVQPNFLPLLAKPELSGNILTMQPPPLLNGLSAAGTYLVFSEIEVLGEGNAKIERRTRLWELWSSAWLDRVELPKIEFERKPDHKYRWEIMFLARPANFIGESFAEDRVDLRSITHVTRNALDI